MSRRDQSRGADGVAIVVAAAMLVAALAGSCESPSTAGDGVRADASTKNDGGGDASGEGAGAGLSCSPTPAGCLCSADPSPSPLAACSSSSVATTAGAQGACCQGAIFCTCGAYLCRSDPAQEYCACGLDYTVTVAIPNGAVVAQCPTPTATQKCCFSAENNLCSCLASDCEAGSTEVTSCTLAGVAICKEGEQTIAACK